MYNKKEFNIIKNQIEEICEKCKNFNQALEAVSLFFTKISDNNSPRKEEFNKTYNVIDIFNSKRKRGLNIQFKDNTLLIIDYYFYNKAPNGIVIFLNCMRRLEKAWFQKNIAAFVKEK